MSRTATLVGVFGTVQSKYLVFIPIGVIHVENVRPPSNDSQSSISQACKFLISGNATVHSILTRCPGWRTCPSLGEISFAEYVFPEAASASWEVLSNCGISVNATTNNVEQIL